MRLKPPFSARKPVFCFFRNATIYGLKENKITRQTVIWIDNCTSKVNPQIRAAEEGHAKHAPKPLPGPENPDLTCDRRNRYV